MLIALGAEQVVESVHWREQVRATREALYSDADDNLAAAAWRQRQQPCVDRRLGEIAAIFEARSEGRPIHLAGQIGHPVFYAGSQTGWQVAVSSQAVAHMGLGEKLQMANAFDNYANMTEVLKREQDAWLELGLLDHPQLLTEGDWPLLHRAYAEANSLSGRMQIITGFVLKTQNLGRHPKIHDTTPTVVRVAVNEFCTPVLAASARAHV